MGYHHGFTTSIMGYTHGLSLQLTKSFVIMDQIDIQIDDQQTIKQEHHNQRLDQEFSGYPT